MKKVKCINSNNADNHLQIGQVYQVEDESPKNYLIKSGGDEYWWSKTRFELVEETMSAPAPSPKRVKCIYNDGASNYLTVGGIYTVKEEKVGPGGYAIYFLKEKPADVAAWRASRFVEVEAGASIHQTSPSDQDPEEERLRNLLKPSRLPHECACGIARAVCQYHKP